MRTGDELAELGEQFNRMSAQLAASYEQLKAREERFELVMQGTNDGVWDWDLKTDDVYFSPRWKGMLGYADGELANRFETWRALLHPEDVDRVQVTLRDYLEKRSPVYEIEFRMRHKDGSYRWISARAGALWDAEGKAYRMTGSHTDITERKQSEEALRQSESRFAQVFHASPVAVSITALEDGRYLDLNDAWLRLFGYERAQVIGNSSLHLSLWLEPEQRAEMIRQTEATTAPSEISNIWRGPNRAKYWTCWSRRKSSNSAINATTYPRLSTSPSASAPKSKSAAKMNTWLRCTKLRLGSSTGCRSKSCWRPSSSEPSIWSARRMDLFIWSRRMGIRSRRQ